MEQLIKQFGLDKIWDLIDETDQNTKNAELGVLLSFLIKNSSLNYIDLSTQLESIIKESQLNPQLSTELTTWYLNTPAETIAQVWQSFSTTNNTLQ